MKTKTDDIHDKVEKMFEQLRAELAELRARSDAAPQHDGNKDEVDLTIKEEDLRGRRLHLNTEWGKIGGRDFEPRPTDLFASDAFKAAWQGSGQARAIYFGACDGQAKVSQALQLPLYKVSTCHPAFVKERMTQLRVDAYGAVRWDGEKHRIDEGWDGWFASHITPMRLPSPESPIKACARWIYVPLPKGLDAFAFDRLFDAEVRKGALDRWMLSEEGRKHCAALGVDPAIGRRMTAYPMGTTLRLSPAEEIAIVTTKGGADRAIAIAERILLRHLGLLPKDDAAESEAA